MIWEGKTGMGRGRAIYTNKIGDCLFICSAMDGQTARPNGLKFGRGRLGWGGGRWAGVLGRDGEGEAGRGRWSEGQQGGSDWERATGRGRRGGGQREGGDEA